MGVAAPESSRTLNTATRIGLHIPNFLILLYSPILMGVCQGQLGDVQQVVRVGGEAGDTERGGGQLFGLSEVVYNWVAGGNKDGGAVYSQDAACCCSDCGQVRRGQGAVHRNYHYPHNNNYHPCAAAVIPGGRNKFHCSLESVPTLLCKPKCQRKL